MSIALLALAGCTLEFPIELTIDGGMHDGGLPRLEGEALPCGEGAVGLEQHRNVFVGAAHPDGELIDVAFTPAIGDRPASFLLLQSGGWNDASGAAAGAQIVATVDESCAAAIGFDTATRFDPSVRTRIARAMAFDLRGGTALLAVHATDPATLLVRPSGARAFGPDIAASVAIARHPDVRAAAAGDLDGDAITDLVLVGGDLARVLRVGASSSTTGAPSGMQRAWIVDVDLDGALDLVAGHDARWPTEAPRPGAGAVLLGDGAGALGAPIALEALTTDGPVALADFDRDGDVDVVQWRHVGERWIVELLRNESAVGSVAFAPPRRLELTSGSDPVAFGGQSATLAVGDVDLDGFPDAVLMAEAWIVWVRGGRTPSHVVFSALGERASAPRHAPIAIGDLEGDGDLDLAIAADVELGRIAILLENEIGGARAVVLELDGAPVAGSEACLTRVGALPADGRCVASADVLLAHTVGVGSTAQRDPGQLVLGVPAPHQELDLRVITRTPLGARAHDFTGVRPGRRYRIPISPP